MDDYRSKYYGEGDMQIQPYQGGGAGVSGGGGGGRNYSQQGHGGGDFRSYSTSATYVSSSAVTTGGGGGGGGNNKDLKFKKAKSGGTSKIWCFNDPEIQRKKRVASYKVYSVEGNIKGTFRKSVRWIKDRYTKVVYGWW
ncbi:glycine-rich cell wall structural protein 1.0-like [Papaver somniferum]|uniref:glycine-rich cell wall structural protein 1.0-like n=1 Tax=Papaver somniferum TaxID=3469 RepID=UPI000E701988|nr:glycine-rich cell wall structural protein 1.0-like [Papaver somniferum]